MIDIGRNLFYALLTELIVVIIAIFAKDDKKKVLTILGIGTLLAGFFGFGSQIIESIPKLSPSTTRAVQLPILTSTPINLAPNPSFEDGTDQPTGWGTYDLDNPSLYSTARNVSYIWDDKVAHSGKRSFLMTDFVPSACSDNSTELCLTGIWVSTRIPIDPNHDYEISFWYINTTQISNAKLVLTMWGDRPDPLGSGRLAFLDSTTQWKYASFTQDSALNSTISPSIKKMQLVLFVSSLTADNGSIWIDDVSVVDLSQP
jgi:hypothetical protein